jgi:hypothetical protein
MGGADQLRMVYNESAEALRHQLGYASMPGAGSIVFVVDDDVSVRESLELLIQHEGWQAKTFASAQEFLDFPLS